jgi:hypothetical protein
MGSVTRMIPVEGNNFSEKVSPIGPIAAPAKKAQPSDLILHELVRLAERVIGEDHRYALELVARRIALNKECAALRAKIMESVENDLAKRWETAKKNCRDAECEIENAKGRIIELKRDKATADDKLAQALAAQTSAINERATVSRFAPVGTAREKDAAILAANKEVETLRSESGQIGQAINNIVIVTLPALDKKFRKLCAEERRLCGMVTGQVLQDEETGLPMNP